MTVENEAPGKRSTCDLQGASKCSSKASVGCCRRFRWRTAPVFIWWSLFSLASGLIRSKHRCSRRTCKRTLIQTKKSKQRNIDWSTWSMHANIDWVQWLQLCVWPRPQLTDHLELRDRRVIYSMRGQSIAWSWWSVAHLSLASYPDVGLPLPPLNGNSWRRSLSSPSLFSLSLTLTNFISLSLSLSLSLPVLLASLLTLLFSLPHSLAVSYFHPSFPLSLFPLSFPPFCLCSEPTYYSLKCP